MRITDLEQTQSSFYHGKGTFQMAFTKPDPHWLYLTNCGLKTSNLNGLLRVEESQEVVARQNRVNYL